MSLLARMASIGYPAMDILVLGVVARMAAGSHRREPAFIFLLTGAAILLGEPTRSSAPRCSKAHFNPGPATSAGWAIFYVMLGASALHPSMRLLSEPGPESESRLTRARLALLACASLTVPLLIVLRRALGEHVDLYVLIGASAAMFSLVLMRMAGIMRRHEEVTEREAALRVELTERAVTERSEARLGSLIKNSSDVVCILGAGHRRPLRQPLARADVRPRPAELTERELTEIIHPDDAAARAGPDRRDRRRAAGPALGRRVPHQPRRAARTGATSRRSASNLLADEAIEGIVLNIRDVSERKAFEDELEHQAFHDTLTGLPNRALFRNRVEHSLASRRRDHLPVAVLFLDIDDFKFVNDSLGHAAGDELLQEIGRRLEDCMRPVDTAARLGGDEFAILIRDSESELHSVEIAQRVMSAVAAPIALEGRDVAVARQRRDRLLRPEHGLHRDAEELLRNADAAMYMAKESGKGGYQLFNPEMHAARDGAHGAEDRTAAGAGGRRVHAALPADHGPRPRRHGRDGGAGALGAPREGAALARRVRAAARGNGADRRRRAPHPLRGLRLGGADAARMPARAAAVDGGQRLGAPAAAPRVHRRGRPRCSRRRGIVPSSLTLELTESVMMQDMEVSLLRLEALRRLGVKLAIDDFGTGYSSLNYVRELPVDILKIDRSFLADTNPQVAEMTASIVELARIFNLKAVAEGVENLDQLARLQGMNCDFGQGFHFAKPLPPEEILALINAQRAAGGSALEAGYTEAAEPAVELADS